ncbi:alpha/beta-hydrolase [Stipitochalara longipes BDJ]|nr:alpha/beta-hydrolase [Stipitochalara longipes BDJ]
MSILSARWILYMKASIWRALMAIGMKFHHFAEPRPPRPNFKIVVPSRLSPRGGTFKLVFYVPDSYLTATDGYRFPVVVNFHGGGFTLGTGTDDARWASTVVNLVDAVFVSVEYRLAPEYPFSVGVEDGTDAIMYLASHAEELRLDQHRMALSGFSAGGNFAFTVPLMLHDLQIDAGKRTLRQPSLSRPSSRHSSRPSTSHLNTSHSHLRPHGGPSTSAFSSTLSLPRPQLDHAMSSSSILKLSDLEPTALEIAQEVPDLTLKAIVSFYPPTDFRSSRKEKRATNPAPEKNLPPMLTNLFDESYMHPQEHVDMNDPYLSPAAASDSQLRSAYPDDIILYTCEYDMLNVEGKAFGERLKSDAVGKTVHGGEVKAVPHAFDKKPNPVHFPKSADRIYSEACAELKRVFGGRVSVEERTQLELSKTVERFDEDELRAEGDEEGGPLIGEGGTTRGERERERERRWREAPGITIDAPAEPNGVI